MNQLSAVRAAAMLLCAAVASTQAETYYVDNSVGNNNNNGTLDTSPWKTLSKVNSSVKSGDTVKLRAAQTWYETLIVKSGVTYTSYSPTNPGARANISGVRSLQGLKWDRYGSNTSNIWVTTTNAQIEGSGISQLLVNGVRQTLARTPNVGKGDFTAPNSRYARIQQDGNGTTLNIASGVVSPSNDINGATVFSRNNNSDLTEYRVSSMNTQGTQLTLSHVSELDDWGVYNEGPLPKNFGYWLENKLWMLDSPGEWYFDAANHKLYVWLSNSSSPNTIPPGSSTPPLIVAASQANGIVADNVYGFTLSNITVQDTRSDGIAMNHTHDATLDNLLVFRAGRRGISMAGSQNNVIRNSFVDRSVKEGIWLGHVSNSAPAVAPLSQQSTNVSILSTQITNSGKGGHAAGVRLGEGGSFSGNVVNGSSSAGILAMRGNTIENNQVLNTCTDFDDCGGIYVAQPPEDPTKITPMTATIAQLPLTDVKLASNVVINNNVVNGGTGSTDGVPTNNGTDTRGIYLDDYANNVTVTNNYVSGMQHGIMLHRASNNSIRGNLMLNNRANNLLLQEDPVLSVDGKTSYTGKMVGNVINGNAFVANKSASNATLAIPNVHLTAEQGQGQTNNLATFDRNRYTSLNPNSPDVIAYNNGTNVAVKNMLWATWQSNDFKNDLQGAFYQYKTTSEAWGFYNPIGAGNSTGSSVYITSIPSSSTPKGPFTNLLTNEQVKVPFELKPGTSIILFK